MGKITSENKQYFQTNAELAKENSDLHIQLQRSTKMNNLLLQQSFEIRSKLAETSLQNCTLTQKNQAYKRKLIEFREQSKMLLDAVQEVHLSPISEQTAKKIALQKPTTISQLANSFQMVDLVGKERKQKLMLHLEAIPEEDEEPIEVQSAERKKTDESSVVPAQEKQEHSNDKSKQEHINDKSNLQLKQEEEFNPNSTQQQHKADKQKEEESNPNSTQQQHKTEKQKVTNSNLNSPQEKISITKPPTQPQSKKLPPIQTAKRIRKPINYKLPNLHTKLRKGDPFTDNFGS